MPETGAERALLVGIPHGLKQAADFVGPLAGGADDAHGGGGLRAARLYALEQDALELAAVLRAVGINAAAAAIERGAWLDQVWRAQDRKRVANGQAEQPQPRGIIARLQREVSEDDPVAAQPAGSAEPGLKCRL